MKFVFTLSICLGFSLLLVAQSPDCYQKTINSGIEKKKKGDYRGALNLFIAARGCNPKNDAEIDREIDNLFKVILELREEAQKQKGIAEKNAIEAQKQKKIAEGRESEAQNALKRVEEEQTKNKRIIDAFYFYGDSLALAVKKDDQGKYKYGFINKNGDTLIAYKYDEASTFNQYDGYARVKKRGVKYLLDTKGKEYTLAETLEEINGSTIVLDLHDKRLSKIPPGVFQHPQLQILLLYRNHLTSLPAELGNLTNLQTLDLSGNTNLKSLPAELGKLTKLQKLYLSYNENLNSLPAELGKLTQLQTLDLSSCPIPEKEKQKIKSWLPHCQIDF